VRVAQLVRREAAPHAGPAELAADRGARPWPALGGAIDHAEQRPDRQLGPGGQPWAELLPAHSCMPTSRRRPPLPPAHRVRSHRLGRARLGPGALVVVGQLTPLPSWPASWRAQAGRTITLSSVIRPSLIANPGGLSRDDYPSAATLPDHLLSEGVASSRTESAVVKPAPVADQDRVQAVASPALRTCRRSTPDERNVRFPRARTEHAWTPASTLPNQASEPAGRARLRLSRPPAPGHRERHRSHLPLDDVRRRAALEHARVAVAEIEIRLGGD
jgi:hypothetical protein